VFNLPCFSGGLVHLVAPVQHDGDLQPSQAGRQTDAQGHRAEEDVRPQPAQVLPQLREVCVPEDVEQRPADRVHRHLVG